MTDFQRVLKFVSIAFFASLFAALCLALADAVLHLPLADYLVKKLCDLMLVCLSGLVGILAGKKLERRNR